MWKTLSAAVLILTLSSCTDPARVEYITVPLPLASQPSLPKVSDAELVCLPDNVYEKLARRDHACQQYAEELRVTIESTH